jgi:hypothetical protein
MGKFSLVLAAQENCVRYPPQSMLFCPCLEKPNYYQPLKTYDVVIIVVENRQTKRVQLTEGRLSDGVEDPWKEIPFLKNGLHFTYRQGSGYLAGLRLSDRPVPLYSRSATGEVRILQDCPKAIAMTG